MSPWDIPVFRSAYFPKRVHRTLFSKTLDLQVRFAHPPNPAPSSRFFVLFRSAYFPSAHRNLLSEGSGVSHGLFCDSAPSPIRAPVFRRAYWLRQTLRLQPLRGLHQSTLCFFFQNIHAPGSLRSPSEPRTVLSSLCAFPVGLFSVSAPNRLFELLRCFARLIRQAETHDLQPHSRPPSKRTALSPLKRSCFSRFVASEPRTVLPSLLH